MERAGRLIVRMKLPAGAVSIEQLTCRGWGVAVGKRIARHTRPIGLIDRRLVVEVEDAVWQKQLFTLKTQILAKLEEVLGPHLVHDIEFRLGLPRRLPQRAMHPKTVDEADCIEDPLLRIIYRESRKRESA
jgi:predicted nucleic acid-binding Zn ribbon protein